MAVISYGSESPMADNSTRDGRAQNRRVVILVYE
jgi:outer membrane protein OmpA-like peptidoglycan-associated protein